MDGKFDLLLVRDPQYLLYELKAEPNNEYWLYK